MKTKIKQPKPLRGGALARAAVNQILKHPETWDQKSYHSECGTTHCFAGWCQILAGFPVRADLAYSNAVRALNLSGADAGHLFSSSTPLYVIYNFAKNHECKPVRKKFPLLKV